MVKIIIPLKEVSIHELKGTYNPVSIFPADNIIGRELWKALNEEGMGIKGGEVRYDFEQPTLNGLISTRKIGRAPLDAQFGKNQQIFILGYTLTNNILSVEINQWDDNYKISPYKISNKKVNLGIEAIVTYEGKKENTENGEVLMVGKTIDVLEKFFKNYNEI